VAPRRPGVLVGVKTTVAFARRGLDPVRLAGNHVIMATAGACALYAHLAPGSVAVTRGQRVRAGEVLGRVGHSGNSTAPHLHFQLMDSADPLRATGIPCAFAAYLMERDGQWRRVERGIPHRRERIRSVSAVPARAVPDRSRRGRDRRPCRRGAGSATVELGQLTGRCSSPGGEER
jgi:murein DD-endopeptidase MepM/ murein hydrolase activator NlpD